MSVGTLMTRYIHDQNRLNDITDAMIDYIGKWDEIPDSWWREYNHLIKSVPLSEPEWREQQKKVDGTLYKYFDDLAKEDEVVSEVDYGIEGWHA